MTWIQTISGKAFDLANPDPAAVDFDEIATVLGRIPRFGGHTDYPYSVAQHCVEGARAILRDLDRADSAAAFLLHDAHEAYIGDLTAPMMRAMDAYGYEFGMPPIGISAVIKRMKWRIDGAIFAAAGLTFPPPADICKIVKEYDVRMLRTERDALMVTPQRAWNDAVESAAPVKGCDLPRRVSDFAFEWLELFRELIVDSKQQS